MTELKKVFIIDDDVDDQEIVTMAFKTINPAIEVDGAYSSEEGLIKLTDADNDLPDAIMLDLNMPRINGKQCLVEIKRNTMLQPIPIIIYTTSALSRDMEETKQLGASYYLTKPNRFDELCNELRKILNSF